MNEQEFEKYIEQKLEDFIERHLRVEHHIYHQHAEAGDGQWTNSEVRLFLKDKLISSSVQELPISNA